MNLPTQFKLVVMKVLIKVPLLLFVLLAYAVLAMTFPSHLGVSKKEISADAVIPAVISTDSEDGSEEVTPSETGGPVEVKPEPLPMEKPTGVHRGPKPIFKIGLISSASLNVTINDLLIIAALFLLFIEIFKATRSDSGSIIDHMLSTFVFIAYLVAFLIWAPAGTGTFLILGIISLIDVLCGFSVSIPSARKDIAFDR